MTNVQLNPLSTRQDVDRGFNWTLLFTLRRQLSILRKMTAQKYFSATYPPKERNRSYNLIIPGLPKKIMGEYKIKRIIDIFFYPDIGFRIEVESLVPIYDVHWISILAMRPYNILNSYIRNLYHGDRKELYKLNTIVSHPILSLLSCNNDLVVSSVESHLNSFSRG